MKREKNMADYKYFENVEKNAYFTEVPCQFCGSKHHCLDGVFFEKENITSINGLMFLFQIIFKQE